MTDAGDQAQERLFGGAETLGADGVTDVRFTTASIADSGGVFLANGTAVRLR